MKSICAWRSKAAASDCDCATEVMFAMLEALAERAVVGREVMRERVARARARMARKASWSVLQVLEDAQATSMRVPFVLLDLPEAKTLAIAGRREAWRDVQRVCVCFSECVREVAFSTM